MKAPENLARATEGLEPQAILILDSNTIMDYPQFLQHEIPGPGPLVFVVPQVVDNELLSLTFHNDPKTKQKALGALSQLQGLYKKGDPANGIELGDGRLLITVRAPRPTGREGMPLEEDQVQRYLGLVDAALLRLADACKEDIPRAQTVLVTKDKNLTHVAMSCGLSVCTWPELRLHKTVDQLLRPDDQRSGPVQDVDTLFSSSLDPSEKRPVSIAMTLEEIRSEDDYLVAKGYGRLEYDEKDHLFRWTYPYKNAEKLESASLFEMIGKEGGMPIENLDFMGENEERIPEPVRRFACSILEQAGWDNLWDRIVMGMLWRSSEGRNDSGIVHVGMGWLDESYGLQPPLVRARLAFTYLEAVHWGFYGGRGRLAWAWQPDGEDEETRDLFCDYFNRCEDLMDLTGANIETSVSAFTSLYADAFEMYKELTEKVGKLKVGQVKHARQGGLDITINRVPGTPEISSERSLKWLLDIALSSWPVGHTREEDFTYSPFASP